METSGRFGSFAVFSLRVCICLCALKNSRFTINGVPAGSSMRTLRAEFLVLA